MLRLSIIENSTGLLSKTRMPDGTIIPAAALWDGVCKNVQVEWDKFGDLVLGLKKNQALCLGSHDVGVRGEEVKVVTKKKKANGMSDELGVICRSKDYIDWNASGVLYFDFDVKGLKSVGEGVERLLKCIPELDGVGYWITPSASSGLRGDGSGVGFHFWIRCVEVNEELIEKFRAALKVRLWLGGEGWIESSAAGTALERFLVDLSVFAPERIVFEAGAWLEGLDAASQEVQEYVQMRRDGVFSGGGDDVFDLANFVNRVAQDDMEVAAELKEAMLCRDDVVKGLAVARVKWIENRAERDKVTLKEAGRILERAEVGVLTSDVMLSDLRVSTVLAEWEEGDVDWEGGDPLEPEYNGGHHVAKLFYNGKLDGWCLHSFAHGGRSFKLRWNYKDCVAWIESLNAEKLQEEFHKLYWLDEAVNAAVRDSLYKKVGAVCGTTKNVVVKTLEEEARKLMSSASTAEASGTPSWAEEMNSSHAWCLNQGGVVILNFDSFIGLGMKNGISYSTPMQLKEMYRAEKVWIGDKKVNKADAWLETKYRKEYGGIYFKPESIKVEAAVAVAVAEKGAQGRDLFNLWRGWNVSPVAGECSRLKEHIFEVICGGVDEYYVWVLDWCARILQDPAYRVGTAIILRGDQGTGKDTFVNMFQRWCGSHFTLVSDASRVTARFNMALAGCLVMHANEAFWGGNKADSGALKGVITEDILTAEAKGKDPIQIANYCNIIMSSNNQWIVPADLNERRYMVLDVSSKHMQQSSWFKPLYKEIKMGAYEAMMVELSDRKITSDLRHVLVTDGLKDQMIRGMSPEYGFFINALEEGLLAFGDWVAKDKLYDMYCGYCDNLHARKQAVAVFFRSLPVAMEEKRFGTRGSQKRCVFIPTKDKMESKLFSW